MNDSTTAGAAFSCCFAEAPVDAEAQNLRHSEAEGRGIPYGGAKRCIIVTRTNQQGDSSDASLPLNDVQEVSAALGAAWIVSKGTESALPWTRKPKVSVIQRGTQYPVESPMEGGKVRRRYPGGTICGIPAQSARMTAIFQSRHRYLYEPTMGFFGRSAPSE